MIQKINNLQALRAFAALNVVLFHTIGTSASYGFAVDGLNLIKGWGANGVDVFFVLSGFIMVYIQKEKKINPFAFFIDRVTRIAPLYWLLTFAVVVLAYALPSVFRSDLQGMEMHALVSIIFMSQTLLGKMPVLYDGWTLEYEMFFYLCFAIGLLFSKKSITYLFVMMAIGLFVGLGLIDSVAVEFLIGVFLGCIYLELRANQRLCNFSLCLGLAWLVLTIFIYKLDLGFFGNRVLLYGCPSFFIIYGLLGISQIQSGLLTKLGDASYSIYLIQVFTIPAFYKFCNATGWFVNLQTDILAMMCLVSTAFAGWILYQMVEKRLTWMVRATFRFSK